MHNNTKFDNQIHNNFGHRLRLRSKFMKAPIRTLGDYEILEMILYSVFSRQDTKDIAKRLLQYFGSLKAVIMASPAELKSIKGIGDAAIFQFKLIGDLFSRMHLPVDQKVSALSNWNAVINYCTLTMGNVKQEYCRVFYLDSKNAILGDEILQNGTIDSVVLYPREIARHCVVNGASAIILVHNHPSGEAKPSKEDVVATKQVHDALKAINVKLHDHLIIAGNEFFSFKHHSMI